jgi:hypothetical protein
LTSYSVYFLYGTRYLYNLWLFVWLWIICSKEVLPLYDVRLFSSLKQLQYQIVKIAASGRVGLLNLSIYWLYFYNKVKNKLIPKLWNGWHPLKMTCIHAYYSRLIPKGIPEATQIFLRDANVLLKWLSYEEYCRCDRW